MNTQQFVMGAVRTMRILWAALTASTVLVAVVATFVVAPGPDAPVNGTNQLVIAVVALAGAVASFVIPVRVYRQAASRARHRIAEPEPVPGGERGPARFAEPDAATRQAFATWFAPFIVSMALSESVSLDGLIEHVFRAPPALAYGLFAAGTVLVALRFPRPEQVLAAWERVHGASFPAPPPRPY